MTFTLEVANYRAIRKASLEADGVSLIVGPNGSGKTTLLSALQFMHNVLTEGYSKALDLDGGPHGFVNLEMRNDEATSFALSWKEARWTIQLWMSAGGITSFDEDVTLNQQPVFAQKGPSLDLYEHSEGSFRAGMGSVFGAFMKHTKKEGELGALHTLASSYVHYRDYRIPQLRLGGSPSSSDRVLEPHGRNAFAVLRNWFNTRPERHKVDFIVDALQIAFPQFFDDLDYEGAGQTVTLRLFRQDSLTPLPVHLASNGFYNALLHLMAVVSTPSGGLVSIDEPENGLHPHAINMLLEAFERWSSDHDVTVLLATHSPFILNRFRGSEDRVFVMGASDNEQLTRIDKLADPNWLRQFALGDLYGHDFARQDLRPHG